MSIDKDDFMKKVSGEQIEFARSLLLALGPVPAAEKKVSNREAIIDIKTEIKDALDKGYTIKQIAELLTSSGLEIKESTLKSYIKEPKKESPAKTKKKSSAAAKKKAKAGSDDKQP